MMHCRPQKLQTISGWRHPQAPRLPRRPRLRRPAQRAGQGISRGWYDMAPRKKRGSESPASPLHALDPEGVGIGAMSPGPRSLPGILLRGEKIQILLRKPDKRRARQIRNQWGESESESHFAGVPPSGLVLVDPGFSRRRARRAGLGTSRGTPRQSAPDQLAR